MSNSNRTSRFGPRVSFSTTKSDPGPVHVQVPSTATLGIDGQAIVRTGGNLNIASGGTLDIKGIAGLKFSNITNASPTSLLIPDGYLSIVSHSADSLVIAIRSGATLYRFTNDAGGVL
jgi:hypothetical protein